MAQSTISKPYIEKRYTYNALPSNSNVSPFTGYTEFDIANDVSTHGEPVSIYVLSQNSMAPALANYYTSVGLRIRVYGKAGYDGVVVVQYSH